MVNHLREEFKDKLKTKRFEIVEFLPAYSHKPEQISTDFFTLLASKLKKYHGSLNQSMLSYAAKLIELGVNGKKDIQGLLKPTDWFTENKSASQAYLELKEIFTQIDIKTIVIIDDVDRLGKEEILEVLRIIRNTANFPNTIFIVAYDKDYVIGEIGNDLKYLDKYFQYELFVPPHRREDLLRSFSEIVLRNKMELDAQQLKKLKEVVNVETLNKTLLDRFVFSYRDVKVLTNIYCTNLCLLTEEVDYIDLLHFTLMNRYFPKQVRFIYNNFDDYFIAKKTPGKPLYLKKHDPFKGDITVASFIADLNIENDSEHYLFKRLFLSLFGLDDDPKSDPKISGAEKYEEIVNFYNKQDISPYSPNKELSIRNADRSHIYFEVLVRKDDISNKDFWDKMGTDDFKKYIEEFLSPLPDLKRKGLEKKIEKKLKDDYEKINDKTKIKNAIWACHEVRGAYQESNLVEVLSTNIIVNYPNALADIFGGDNDVFAAFFKKNLWDNPDISLAYKIVAILKLSEKVEYCSSNNAPRYEGKPVYFGSNKEQIKKILISKTNKLITKKSINIQVLRILSTVLDSSLSVSDADIGFSNSLYSNKDQLFAYLGVVKDYYGEKIRFDAAIFKVFTDKDKFKEKCFGIEGSKELKIIIREFHHLLKLHNIRKDAVSLSEFTPFYFFNMKIVQFNSSEYKQTIYVQKTGDFKLIFGNPDLSEYSIYAQDIGNDRVIIEGHRSYEELLERIIPPSRLNDIEEYLSENEDKFEILSIQTPEHIEDSLLSYIKYYKTLKD